MTLLNLVFLGIAAPLALFLGFYLILVTVTLILTECTRLRQQQRTLNNNSKSTMFVGRVSHSRKLPATHSFSYPIFMACVDLEEDYDEILYPLSLIMAFKNDDHYKNNEGDGHGHGHDSSNPNNSSLAERTLTLIREKTKNKFQPSLETHSVKLLTHLRYYGYCFNPVSFYYILRKDSGNKIDAIVAEVSNTPWNEMQCYVLHPDSIDMMQKVKPGRRPKKKDFLQQGGTPSSINYLFLKTFHVSPFMDMEHLYDWTFWEILQQDTKPLPLRISTSMYKGDDLYFNAYLQMTDRGWHPYTLCWQLIRFPVFCMLLQLWIHIQALNVFLKGVPYVPHPQGSETTASLWIGKAMIPVFAAKDWLDGKLNSTKSKTQ